MATSVAGIPLVPGADSPAPTIAEDDEVDAELSMGREQQEGGGSGGGSIVGGDGTVGVGVGGREADADDDMWDGIDSKFVGTARDLLTNSVKASFNATAPVSLEQVRLHFKILAFLLRSVRVRCQGLAANHTEPTRVGLGMPHECMSSASRSSLQGGRFGVVMLLCRTNLLCLLAMCCRRAGTVWWWASGDEPL